MGGARLSRRLSGRHCRPGSAALLGEFDEIRRRRRYNLVVNFVVFLALATTVFAGGELKANVVAFIVATTSSYLMNRHWTFRHRPRSTRRREYALFFSSTSRAGIELAGDGAGEVPVGHDDPRAAHVAKGLGIGLGTIFRFYTYRTFVFSESARRMGRQSTPVARGAGAPTAPGGTPPTDHRPCSAGQGEPQARRRPAQPAAGRGLRPLAARVLELLTISRNSSSPSECLSRSCSTRS